jgi:hypothetical protein
MAEDKDKTKEEKSDDSPKVYLIKSVVRGRYNRTERKQQPGRQRFVQRLAGGRFVVRRARPVRITEAALKHHLDTIKEAVAAHSVVVTTLTGQHVDLNTFEVGPAKAAKPKPNPPLDSAKNDKNKGVGYKVPATPEGSDAVPELLQKSKDSSEEDTQKESKSKKTKAKKPHVLTEAEQEELEKDLEEMSVPAKDTGKEDKKGGE